jgi:hypothetical protein
VSTKGGGEMDARAREFFGRDGWARVTGGGMIFILNGEERVQRVSACGVGLCVVARERERE